MVTLLIPSHLSTLIAESESSSTRVRSLAFNPGQWLDFARQLRGLCPGLANRVLTESDEIAPGFALIVNETVVQAGYRSLALQSGDELSIIAALAGG